MRIRSLYRESFADRRASLTLLAKKSLSSAGAVPPPSDQPAVVASSLSGRPAGHVADYLGRESEIVSLSSYFFDPVIYEANESSSACRLGLNLKSKPVRPLFLGASQYALAAQEAIGSVSVSEDKRLKLKRSVQA